LQRSSYVTWWHTSGTVGGRVAKPRPDIQKRAFEFTCTLVAFCDDVSDTRLATPRIISQLFDSGSGIGANLEEATAGQTKPDFIAKTFIALKEARETRYWLRVLKACRPAMLHRVSPLLAECEQLVAILTAILRSARGNDKRG
jgi:four helix bundle protein